MLLPDTIMLLTHTYPLQVVYDDETGYGLSYTCDGQVFHKKIERAGNGYKFTDSKIVYPTYVDMMACTLSHTCRLAALVVGCTTKHGKELRCRLRIHVKKRYSEFWQS